MKITPWRQKFFKIGSKPKEKKTNFSFLSFFFRFFLNEIYRPKNEIYCKTAQKISEKRGNFRFLNSSPVKQKKKFGLLVFLK
jgi:hypothetical protein